MMRYAPEKFNIDQGYITSRTPAEKFIFVYLFVYLSMYACLVVHYAMHHLLIYEHHEDNSTAGSTIELLF